MRGSEEKIAGLPPSAHTDCQNLPADAVSEFDAWLSVFDQGPDAVFAWNAAGLMTYWNLAATDLFGWTKHESLGHHYLFRIPEAERSEIESRVHWAIRGRQSVVWLDAAKCGKRIGVRASVHQLTAGENRVPRQFCIAQSAIAPQTSELCENMIEGCQIFDHEFRYMYLNPVAVRQSKRDLSELIGRRLSEVYPGIEATELYAVLNRCMRDRLDCEYENEFVFPNGARGVFNLHIVPAPQGLLIYSLDVAETRRLAAQLRQSKKLIAIGQLTAGAAHDLANLLTVVAGGSEMLLEQFPPLHPHHALAIGVRDAAERCSDMVRQILAFRRQTDSQSTLTDLNQVIEKYANVLRGLTGETISIDVRLSEIQGAVNLHPSQLEQILMNLAVNARDSMPHGGTLSISTDEVIPESDSTVKAASQPSRFVKLKVSDTGFGMSEDVLARIFEPFFTTKHEGKGAGLGLMTVYEIVKLAGGSITVDSAPGKGSTFLINLPIF